MTAETAYRWHQLRGWSILKADDGRLLCVLQAADRRAWEIRVLRVVDDGRFQLGTVLEEADSLAVAKRIAQRRMDTLSTPN